VVVPIAVFFAVATTLLMRRGEAATRFLASTIGCMPRGSVAGTRVKCGVSVRRPGRMAFSYPSCEVEATALGLVLYGPMSGRMAEFCSGSGWSAEVRSGLMHRIVISSDTARVVVVVRGKDATQLGPWSAKVTAPDR
jgi:hypothetical protein